MLSCRYQRRVAHDNPVRLGPRWVHLRGPRSYAGRRVEVRELLDGRLVALHDGLVRGTTPAPAGFVLKPRRSASQDRRASRRRPTPAPPPPPPARTTPKTHTGRIDELRALGATAIA